MIAGTVRAAWTLSVLMSCILSPKAEAQATWRISEQPALVMGATGGDSSHEFHDVRGVLTAEDTLIVVADGGSRQLRVFTAEGRHVRTFGSAGDGPAEFSTISWADRCGGSSIVVYDFARARVTNWRSDGTLVSGFAVESTDPGVPPYALSCGPRGEFVVTGWPNVAGARVPQGPYRLDVKIGVLSSTGRLQRVVGTFPGPERYRYTSTDGPRPLGKVTIARMSAEGVLVGTGDAYLVTLFRADGRSVAIGRPQQRLDLTRELIEQWKDSVVSEVPDRRRAQTRSALDRYDFPETLPAYSDFRLDALGLLWVARFPVPGETSVQWDIFTQSGAQVATIRIPGWLRPTEFGKDHVLGVGTDPLGVQRVYKYRLTR